MNMIKMETNKCKIMISWLFLFLLCACQEDEENLKYVDLRYNPETRYEFPANPADEDKVTFQVKSTDVWRVYGTSDWCIITPEEGEPGKKYDVSISCLENKELDDRTDTVTVQSDHWIGTKFVVFQKGTAYLNAAAGDTGEKRVVITKEGGTKSIKIEANQKWKAKIPEGITWLTIENGEGEGDGTIKLSISEKNLGEQRECFVAILDRHGKENPDVGIQVVQEGVLLAPNITYSRVKEKGETLTIQVESNAIWTVAKGNPKDDWYDLPNEEFDGNRSFDIVVRQNTGSGFRDTEIVLQTKAVEGLIPVMKKIKIKQAYKPKTTKFTFDANDWWIDAGKVDYSDGKATLSSGAEMTMTRTDGVGDVLGTYSFHLTDISDDATMLTCYVFRPWTVIAWGLWSGGTTGWTKMEFEGGAPGLISENKEITPVCPRLISMSLTAVDETVALEWSIDNETIGTYVATKENFNGIDLSAIGWVKLRCKSGNCTFDSYEYAPPLDWDDDDLKK